MRWALPEWTVLAVLHEGPRHGFAIAALTADDGELGRVWQIPRPVVYRALSRLEEEGLAAPTVVESGPGPRRTLYAATPDGRAAVQRWLREPVEHVREIRSQLLMKLALLDRAGADPGELLRRQRATLEPIAAALAVERGEGFDQVLLAWRQSTATAALAFLDEISARSARRG